MKRDQIIQWIIGEVVIQDRRHDATFNYRTRLTLLTLQEIQQQYDRETHARYPQHLLITASHRHPLTATEPHS